MEDSEIFNLRQRIHKLSDDCQATRGRLAEQTVVVDMLQRQVELMQGTLASRELLNATVGTTIAKIEMLHAENKAKIETLHSENNLKFEHVDTKLDHLHDDIMPIRRAINWAAMLVVGAVIVALLALVINSGVTP